MSTCPGLNEVHIYLNCLSALTKPHVGLSWAKFSSSLVHIKICQNKSKVVSANQRRSFIGVISQHGLSTWERDVHRVEALAEVGFTFEGWLYKNLLIMRGWDRIIRPWESRIVIPIDGIFYSILTRLMGYFSFTPLNWASWEATNKTITSLDRTDDVTCLSSCHLSHSWVRGIWDILIIIWWVGSRRVAAPGTIGWHETKSSVIRSFLAQPRDVIRPIRSNY